MTPVVVQRQQAIRAHLRVHMDGLTVANLCVLVGHSEYIVKATLEEMPDAYIDRWVDSPSKHRYVAVWCVVVPPPNCPKPGE